MGCSSSKESESASMPPSVPPSGFQQRHIPSSPSSVGSHTHPFTINIQPPTPIKDTFAPNENDMKIGMSSISEERVFAERGSAAAVASPQTPPKQQTQPSGSPVFQTPERIVQEQEQQFQQSQSTNVKSDRKSQEQMDKLVTQLQQLTQSNLLLLNQLQQSTTRSETLEKELANAKKLATDPDHIALIEARRDSSPREVPMGKVTFKRMQAEVDHSNALQIVLDQTKAQLKESQDQVASIREGNETLITRCSETQNLLFASQKRTAELEQSNHESLAAQKNLAESLATSQREGEVSLGFISELRMHIASLESKQTAERAQTKGEQAALQSQTMELQAALHQAERTIRDKDLQIEQLRALLHGKLLDQPPPEPSTEHLSHPIAVAVETTTVVSAVVVLETNERAPRTGDDHTSTIQPTAEHPAAESSTEIAPSDYANVTNVTEPAPETYVAPSSSVDHVLNTVPAAVEPVVPVQQVESPSIQQLEQQQQPQPRVQSEISVASVDPVSTVSVPPLSDLPLVQAASDTSPTAASPEDAEADAEFNQWLAWKEDQRRKEQDAHELESGPPVSAGNFPFSATAASTLNNNKFTATESTLPIVPDLILPTIENDSAAPSVGPSKQNTSRRTESMESARKRVFPTRADEDEFQLWLWEKKQEEELASMIARAKTIEEQKMASEQQQQEVSPASSPSPSPKATPKSSPSPSMRDAQLNSSDAEKEFAIWLRQNKASHSSRPLLEDEEKQQQQLLSSTTTPRSEKLSISKHAPAASWPHFNAFDDKSPSPPVMASSGGRKAWNTSQDLTHTVEIKQQIIAASKQGQQGQSSSSISGPLSGRRVAQQPPSAATSASTAVLPTWAQPSSSQESKSNDYLTPANMLPPALAAKVTSGALGVTGVHHEKSSSFSYVNWQSTHAPIEGSMAIASAAQRQAQSMVNQRAQEQLISHSSSQPVLSLSPVSPGLSTRFAIPSPTGSATGESNFILPFEPLLWLSAGSFHTDAGRTLLISQPSMSDSINAPMHIGGWLDSSPFANHATLCSSGGRCLFRDNVERLNGQPCVELGGSSAMKFRQPINLCGEFFIIIVSKVLGSSPYLLGGQHGVHLPVFTSGVAPDLVTRKSATRVSESKSSAMGGYSISSFARRGDSGRLHAWLHGHDVSTGNAINNEEIRIEFLGQVVDEVREAQFVSPCSIAEILLFDRVPSDSQRSLLESYLNEKYLVYARRKMGV